MTSKVISTSKTSRNDVIASVAMKTGVSRKKVAEVLKEIFEQVGASVLRGHRVSLLGFGAFYLRESGGFERQGKVVRRVRRVSFSPCRGLIRPVDGE